MSSFGLREDGTVYPKNTLRYKALESWENLLAVSAPSNFYAGSYFGMQSDGTILTSLNLEEGDTAPESMKNLKWIQSISRQGDSDRLFGLTKDNTILKCGQIEEVGNVLNYDGILRWYSGFAALYEDGTFLYAVDDTKSEKITGVKQAVELLEHQSNFENERFTHVYAYMLLMEDFSIVDTWTDIIQLEPCGIYDVFGLKADGSLVGAGRWSPRLVESMQAQNAQTYKAIKATQNQSLFVVKNDGTLAVLVEADEDTQRDMSAADGWEDVESVSIGSDHIAALLEDGTVKAAGNNHCGQCDVEEWKDVVYLTTGKNCTLGITSSGDLLMAGSLY